MHFNFIISMDKHFKFGPLNDPQATRQDIQKRRSSESVKVVTLAVTVSRLLLSFIFINLGALFPLLLCFVFGLFLFCFTRICLSLFFSN